MLPSGIYGLHPTERYVITTSFLFRNEAPTQQAAGYLPIGLIDVASGCPPTLQAAGYLNENERDDK